jgi:hypothetical protein
MFGDDLPTKPAHYVAVTGDVAKWYAAAPADAVAATEQLVVYGFSGCVTTAKAGDIAVFSDEDGNNIFGGIELTLTGNFSVSFQAPKIFPLGKDIKVDVTMSTGRFSLDFDCAYITM